MILSFFTFKKFIKSDEKIEENSSLVSNALAAIEDGDIEAAYDMLYKTSNRTKEEQELFNKFKFVIVESSNGTKSDKFSYNNDGYLLTHQSTDNGISYSETATYNEQNNLIAYGITGDTESYTVKQKFNDDGQPIFSSINHLDETLVTEEFTYHSNGVQASYTYKNLHGNSSVVEHIATFDSKGNLLTSHTEFQDGTWNKEVYTYDENGNELTLVCSQSTGESESYVNTYDDHNNILTCVFSNSSGSYEVDDYSYTYDDDGNILVYEYSNNDDIYEKNTYTYDENGNVLTEKISNGSDWWCENVYTYNENGDILTFDFTNSDGDTKSESYTYDEDGRLIDFKKTADGKTQKRVYTYDDDGNYSYGENLKSYTYDKYGNLLQCIHHDTYIIESYTYQLFYYPEGAPYVFSIGKKYDTLSHPRTEYVYAEPHSNTSKWYYCL